MPSQRKNYSHDLVDVIQIDLAQSVGPDNFDAFILTRHFRKNSLFIRSFHGKTNTAKAQREMVEKLVFSHGIARPGEVQVKALNFEVQTDLYRLSLTAFASIGFRQITVYAETQSEAETQLQQIHAQYALPEATREPHFFIITSDHATGSLDTTSVNLPDVEAIIEPELELHYGTDFLLWHNTFVGHISKRAQGVAILRGSPGTGKTTYLRKLMVTLQLTHRFLFMPLKSLGFSMRRRQFRFGWIRNGGILPTNW